MSESKELPWNLAVNYIFAVVEIAVSFTIPGIFAIWIISKAGQLNLEELTIWPGIPQKVQLLNFASVATIAGLLSSQMGDILLGLLDRRLKLSEKIDENFFDELADAHVNSKDWASQFTREQIDGVLKLPEEERTKFFKDFRENVVANAKSVSKRQLSLGISQLPSLAAPGSLTHRHELRSHLSVTDSTYSWFRSMLIWIPITGIVLSCHVGSMTQRILGVTGSALACMIWTHMTIRTYSMHRGAQLAFWVGLGARGKEAK